MDLSFEPETFSGWAPLFPLPGVVLLPGALLPLHVFEPRYRLMLKDALEGEKLIAMAYLLPGFEEDYEGAPAIDEWVGLGRIVAHEPLPDGRSNLLLAGLRRARVLEEDRSRPYRRGKLDVVADDTSGLSADEEKALREKLTGLLGRVPSSMVRDPLRLGVALKMTQLALGALTDLAADTLKLEGDAKRLLLHEARVAERARKLTALLDSELGTGRFPARFSKN
jgi:Lon protease-like protein